MEERRGARQTEFLPVVPKELSPSTALLIYTAKMTAATRELCGMQVCRLGAGSARRRLRAVSELCPQLVSLLSPSHQSA